ncbi:hypothetical protein A1Q2_00023 [Trichosporon asahii var. asahii CBS 8904]|uniref:Uncharacterized protein n=1 Tax=Trichosporon asahii var. asahii (strain CBS 8904) TaxID=1220162 RepID=K1W1N5_TRIAC|nr:hypothetical protein A1Q2_00023 [Trichosporon asahii var. asahii CBS 8904]
MSSTVQPPMSTSTLSLLSTQSISSSNLGLSSGDDMPGSSNRDRRSPDVRVVTPNSSNVILADTARIVGDVPLDGDAQDLAPALAEGDSVKQLQLHDSTKSNESTATATTVNTTTTSRSVSNPSSSTSNAKFRARPAPPTTKMEGLGPRLTKSAALRQGLKWEDPRDIRRMTGEGEVPVDFDNVPGHKRNLALNVASLAQPSVAPRQNRAALLRLGQVPEENVKPESAETRAEMAARNKAREYQERLEKRKQVQIPASLTSPPEIAPRQNRAALLRQGQVPTEQTPMKTAREMAEAAARNKARDAAERAERRKSVTLPASLGTPHIAPRSNRASILRTGGDYQAPKPGHTKSFSATPVGSRSRTGSTGGASSSSATTSTTTTSAGATAGDRPVPILKPSTQPQTRAGPPPPGPARSHARLRSEASTGTAATSSSSSSASASVTSGDKASAAPRRVTINPRSQSPADGEE